MKMKPCPWCGQIPEVWEMGPGTWDISCSPCSGDGMVSKQGNTKREAIENWNRRTAKAGKSGGGK